MAPAAPEVIACQPFGIPVKPRPSMMPSPGWDPGYKFPPRWGQGGRRGGQASADPRRGQWPAAQLPKTVRSCQRPVPSFGTRPILGFLGRGRQLMAKTAKYQRAWAARGESVRPGGAGELEPHTSLKGPLCPGPSSMVPSGAPRAYVGSFGAQASGQNPFPCLHREPDPKGPLIRTFLLSPDCPLLNLLTHPHLDHTYSRQRAHLHTCTHTQTHTHTCKPTYGLHTAG